MQIVNRRYHRPASGDTYVGRAVGRYGLARSPLANPYRISPNLSRDAAIQRYEEWLRRKIEMRDPEVLAALDRLREDSVLMCWCAPEPCHAEVIERVWRARRAPQEPDHAD